VAKYSNLIYAKLTNLKSEKFTGFGELPDLLLCNCNKLKHNNIRKVRLLDGVCRKAIHLSTIFALQMNSNKFCYYNTYKLQFILFCGNPLLWKNCKI